LDWRGTPPPRWLEAHRGELSEMESLASRITEIATNEDTPAEDDGKDPAAVSLGRRGGAKDGPARAAALTPERRKEIAQKAAAKRWEKKE